MKRFSVIFGLALGMLTVGCSQDMPEDTALPSTGDVVTLGVSISPSEEARTSLGDLVNGKYSVLWSEGDKLAVNGKTSSAVSAAQAGTTSATFTVADVKAPFNVLYPAEALNPDGTITIATEQVYTPGSFANGNAVLVGYSEDGTSVSAKHLYSFVKVNVVKGAEDVALKSVTVKALGGEAISGTFHVDYQNATITPAAGQDLVRVSSVEPIAIGNGVSFVVAVPAGTYSAGFEVTVADVDGLGMTRKVTNPAYSNIPGGLLVDMPALTYAPEIPVSIAAPITTAQQLSDFLAAASAGDISAYVMDNGEVVLGSDIDLTGVTLTPAATFTGVFNGQGYALKNWTTSSPLFTTATNATIKNVVLDKSCVLSWPAVSEATCFGFVVSTMTNSTISGCVNNADVTWNNGGASLTAQLKAGALVGLCTDGTITDCINNGNVTINIADITYPNATTQYWGGVAGNYGKSSTGSTLTNCINNGKIDVTVGKCDYTLYVAGVIAAANNGGTVAYAINNGDVEVKFTDAVGYETLPKKEDNTDRNNQGVAVAGISAYTAANFSYCVNNGDISIESDSFVSVPWAGGILGYSGGKIEQCENHGHVAVNIAYAVTGSISSNFKDKDNKTKSNYPEVGGILAVGYKATLDHCTNYGFVELNNTNPAKSVARNYIGGIVGTPYGGSIANCVNRGGVSAVQSVGHLLTDDTDGGKGKQLYIGGIVGGINSDYTGIDCGPVSDCTNYGKVYSKSDTNSGNNYTAGIAGQGDIENPSGSSRTATTYTNCVNHGEVFVEGYAKGRYAGISGGALTLTGCTNYGNVTVSNTAASASVVGGLVGYPTQGAQHPVTNCANYGDISCSATGVNVGGLFGQLGNTAATHTGCTAKCSVTGISAGILVGAYTGTKAIVLGNDEAPMLVAGSVNGTALTQENYTSLLVGGTANSYITATATLLTE